MTPTAVASMGLEDLPHHSSDDTAELSSTVSPLENNNTEPHVSAEVSQEEDDATSRGSRTEDETTGGQRKNGAVQNESAAVLVEQDDQDLCLSPKAAPVTPEHNFKNTIPLTPNSNYSPRLPVMTTTTKGTPSTPSSGNRNGRRPADDGDDSSSNDESSYFNDPKNLPHPRDVRYSYSSTNSPHAPNDVRAKESDASLSFSEDSEDGHNHQHDAERPSSRILSLGKQHSSTTQDSNVTELFPQRITRMHSYSSLVSDDGGSSSDPSIRDELRQVAQPKGHEFDKIPSGRISPVLGQHPPSRGVVFFGSPTSANPDASPPTIMPNYQHTNAIHPQPMSQEQFRAWLAALETQQRIIPSSYLERSVSITSNLDYSVDSQQDAAAAAYFHNTHPYGATATTTTMGPHNNNNMAPRPPPSSSRPHNRTNEPQLPPSQQPPQQDLSSRSSEGPLHQPEASISSAAGLLRSSSLVGGGGGGETSNKGFKVYWKRWVMLMYMSILNLLSDWTCYSVAPIALLTEQAFGEIDPELLVTVFLVANAIASACEPIILSRLGLRRTVLFGALLLMMGSIIKSGGMPPIIISTLQKGQGEWRVYLGFFIVGLSQPLYQCTPALLSASWFPEEERTMATGVALNANQLGIGFAFVFGTLLVVESDDIPSYFSLLSILSTITFLGTLVQFEDAPPTPPSDTARVMRGDLDMKLPSVKSMFENIRKLGTNQGMVDDSLRSARAPAPVAVEDPNHKHSPPLPRNKPTKSEGKSKSAKGKTRRRNVNNTPSPENLVVTGYSGPAPSSAPWGAGTSDFPSHIYPAPSPANVGPVPEKSPPPPPSEEEDDEDDGEEHAEGLVNPYMQHPYYGAYMYPPVVYSGEEGNFGNYPPEIIPPDRGGAMYPSPPGYNIPPEVPTEYMMPYGYPPYYGYPAPVQYWDPRFQHHMYYPPPYQAPMPYQSYQHFPPPPYYVRDYESPQDVLPPYSDPIDEGVEPVLTLTPHHLDINIRDDQVILSIRACMARPGFIHALVSFTVSGIVINTLSTFMDYLVRLNGAGREYTGIVGGTFQLVIMISSLVIGKVCDKTRAYYSIAIGMLVLGAFGLAECGVSLDADRGGDLRWSLIIVALLVGPLQPVSTELGVDVVYPLSENTVLVIQQLFSNLLSAMFIPAFKAMKDVGLGSSNVSGTKPEYTFSFYLLIVLHATATVFFATFNGRYLRYEHELEKEAFEEKRKLAAEAGAFRRVDPSQQTDQYDEDAPLIPPTS